MIFPVSVGDKWSDGTGGLAAGHPDPSRDPTRWLRQRPGRFRPPLLTVSRSIMSHLNAWTNGAGPK